MSLVNKDKKKVKKLKGSTAFASFFTINKKKNQKTLSVMSNQKNETQKMSSKYQLKFWLLKLF
jgi:hypothetical protein